MRRWPWRRPIVGQTPKRRFQKPAACRRCGAPGDRLALIYAGPFPAPRAIAKMSDRGEAFYEDPDLGTETHWWCTVGDHNATTEAATAGDARDVHLGGTWAEDGALRASVQVGDVLEAYDCGYIRVKEIRADGVVQGNMPVDRRGQRLFPDHLWTWEDLDRNRCVIVRRTCE